MTKYLLHTFAFTCFTALTFNCNPSSSLLAQDDKAKPAEKEEWIQLFEWNVT